MTREPDGSLALNGSGVAIEWLVEMNRFPQEALFDRLAAAGQLDLSLMWPLAEAIASFHAAAERRLDHGGTTGMAWVVDGNAAGFAEFGTTCLDGAASARLIDDSRRDWIDRQDCSIVAANRVRTPMPRRSSSAKPRPDRRTPRRCSMASSSMMKSRAPMSSTTLRFC